MRFQYRVKAAGRQQNTMWLTSLADLLALLLAFFVLLFAMNEVKEDKWQDILEKLGYRLNLETENFENGVTAEKNVELFTEQRAFDLDYLENILGEKVAVSSELKDVDVFKAQDRLIISFVGDTYFTPGATLVSDKLVDAVRVLGDSLRYVKNRLEIYGHTDETTVANPKTVMQNNWGLSLSRGLSVADILTKSGYGFPIRVFGMADSRFHELSDITDKEKRFSLARRVDIVIREASRQGGEE